MRAWASHLGPVVAGPAGALDAVVGLVELPVLAAADAVDDGRLEVHQHGARHVPAGLRLVEVDVDVVQQHALALVGEAGRRLEFAIRVYLVLGGDGLPWKWQRTSVLHRKTNPVQIGYKSGPTESVHGRCMPCALTELRPHLVAGLPGADVQNFAHLPPSATAR